ncbi:hypothetical protein [Salinivibrio sp. HTSP]|uniref:DUF7657 domain-containing protein n=1 Tax=Salinivibrio sp. HTSP TaxID=2115977 RepID=UPI000E30C73F|nr:hypothetical protein [Salinivibrio sp. HTSP]
MMVKSLLKLDKFDVFCLLLLIPIVIFALTPSSYGAALSLFGFDGEGLLAGTPRPIRTDEWTVWTPYIQMAVLNGFERFNEFSTYHHDLRGFNAVPLADWGLIFKPLMWPFWLLEPARAFALHHGLIIVSFLLGWKCLFKRLISDLNVDKAHVSWYAAAVSVLLFFTGFSQFWWTTLGPVLAISPWLLLLILRWQHHALHYALLFYVACVWLLSHTYPPIIISIAYFGVMLLFVHQWRWWRVPKLQLVLTAVVCLAGVGVTLWYFQDVISVMINTVYPGQRVSPGGQTSGLLWLSSLLPFIAHSRYSDLLGLNICEVATAGSLLPIIVASLVKPNPSAVGRRAIMGATMLAIFCTLWMLTPVPAVIAKLLLLDKVPSNRLVFLLGLTLNYLALVVLVEGQVMITRTRLVVLATLVAISMFLSSALGLVDWFDKNTPELALVIVAGVGFCLYRCSSQLGKYKKGLIVAMALMPNIYAYGGFNPIQSAFPIFDLHTRDVVNQLEEGANQTPPHWVVSDRYRGAILSGLGLNSFTTVLVQPQLDFFRKMYPDMEASTLNFIFNRYAHIYVSDKIQTPETPFPDQIHVPIWDVKPKSNDEHYQTLTRLTDDYKAESTFGVVDVVDIGDEFIQIKGWAQSNRRSILGNIDLSNLIYSERIRRPDVANALDQPDMMYSGFKLVFKKTDAIKKVLKEQGICLVSTSKNDDLTLLMTAHLEEKLTCKY